MLYVYDALLCEEKDKPVVVETMKRIIREHEVKTSVKADMEVEPVVQDKISTFRLDDQVNLYEILPVLSFSVQESIAIIDG